MKTLAIGAGVAILLFCGLIFVAAAGVPTAGTGTGSQPTASLLAVQGIPAAYLADYQEAATRCAGLSWSVLAGVGKVETDQGDDGTNPNQTSPAGAEGVMQFEPSTFAEYALPGEDNIWDPKDSIDAAAVYLCALGAGNPATLSNALYTYSGGAADYASMVLSWAAQYASSATVATTSVTTGGTSPVAGVVQEPTTPPAGFAGNATVPDPGDPGQCTWWAAYLVHITWSGNAYQWWANAAAAGASESQTPTVGSIVVYGSDYPGSGGFGHVAVVIGVQSSTSFTVSEMNYLGPGIVDERQSANAYVSGFID